MSKAVTLIGGPQHRRTIAVRDSQRDLRFPVAPDFRFIMHADEIPTSMPAYETDTYEIRDVEICGVKIGTVGLHRETMLLPQQLRLR